jgi:hypothetical protein
LAEGQGINLNAREDPDEIKLRTIVDNENPEERLRHRREKGMEIVQKYVEEGSPEAEAELEHVLEKEQLTYVLNQGDNPWTVSRMILQKYGGIEDPTNAQIQQVDKVLTESNKIEAFGSEGDNLDTQLPVGFELDISAAVEEAEITSSQ